MVQDALTREIERRIEELGFELVDLERAGSRARPIFRAYIDRPDSRPGEPGVSLEDCARVSRALEPFLEEREDVAERYVLEVSSPGVERPLVRPRDWERFAGSEVRVKGREPLAGKGRKVEGVLLGISGAEGEERVRLRLPDGEEVEVALAEVSGANLVFRW